MIRITEIKLPLAALPVHGLREADSPSESVQDRMPAAHPLESLRQAAAQTLGIAQSEILELQVFKRSFDARRADILAVFILDVQLAPATEARLLAHHVNHAHIAATPDMAYLPPALAPAALKSRPVVVGFGPCGMFAALLLAQMGFKPLVLERGPSGRVLALAIEGSAGTRVLRLDAIRRTLRQLPSTLFTVTPSGADRWLVEGGGFGHGAGLSQAGAIDLARRGWSSRQILEHYYPGTALTPLGSLGGAP